MGESIFLRSSSKQRIAFQNFQNLFIKLKHKLLITIRNTNTIHISTMVSFIQLYTKVIRK